MNKQEMNLLKEVQRLIEERNALKADKEALIDALRLCVQACDHCDHNLTKPCDLNRGHDMNCTTCTDPCPCRECKAGNHFKWVGRIEPGKHAAKEPVAADMPVGIRAAMEEDKRKKAR